MNAVLLAAGLGTRLRPLTDILPKCLAPVRGRPLLEYWFRMLLDDNDSRALVNTHYHPDLVERYVASSRWAERIVLVREMELLGTGGTVIANRPFMNDSPLMVVHADNLSLFDSAVFIEAHKLRPKDAAMTMMTFTCLDPSSCGIVVTDQRGVVTRFFEKVVDPPGNRANAAVYIFEPEVVEWMSRRGTRFVDISLDVVPHFVGRIATWHNERYHRDIGTLASWRAAQDDYPGPSWRHPEPDPWRQVLSMLVPETQDAIAQLLRNVP